MRALRLLAELAWNDEFSFPFGESHKCFLRSQLLVGNVFLSSSFHFLSFDRFEPSFETYVDIQDWRVSKE